MSRCRSLRTPHAPNSSPCPPHAVARMLVCVLQLFKVVSQRRDTSSASAAAADTVAQDVWRSYADFKALDAALRREAGKLLAAEFPRSSGWMRSFSMSYKDFAETRRVLLENYLKAVLGNPLVNKSKALLNFLKPAERDDWPSAVGDIDLELHDLPHASSQTEWWYYHVHFQDGEGNDYSAFVAFFRVVKHTDKETGKKSYAHAINWALSDVKNKRYVQDVVLDRDSPAVVKKQLDNGEIKDSRLERAYREVLDRGNVPLPDRMFTPGRDAVCDMKKLHLDFESGSVTKNAAGHHVLKCVHPDGKTALELVFEPTKKPVRHGLDGVVKGHDGDDMFYYCSPRCRVTGHFTLDGKRTPVVRGSGWIDHEFGGKAPENDVPSMNYAWNWVAAQLNNGWELSVAELIDPRTTPQRFMESRVVAVDPSGARSQPTDMTLEPLEMWTSVRTFNTYPIKWRLTIPELKAELLLEAPFSDQELMTLIAKPGFWEGRVNVTGTFQGAPVTGAGYVERNGFQ
ncbi:hypothetical protein EON62_03155, partial [archaeon]